MSHETRTTSIFRDLLETDRPLLADGAMGTSLFALGLMSGDSPERWNLTAPERVRAVHDGYVTAGCDIILTNSFGGNSYRLKLHSLEGEVFELNEAAARIARASADQADRLVSVAGSMGPTGELLQPMGALTAEGCALAYGEQAKGLEAGGADVLWLETLSDLGEVAAAVQGVRSVSELPIVVTMSFDTNGRTMMGLTATEMARTLVELEVDAFGANCGNNLADTEAAIAEMRKAAPGTPIVSKANAGIPQWKGDGLQYSGSPDVMAAHAHRLHTSGVQIIGGCCGSTEDHLAHMRRVLDGTITAPDIPAPAGDIAPRSEDGEPRRPRRSRRRG